MSNQNMKIWDFLSKTNPEFTKPFSKFGGKTLTTIDPHYQIQMMTNAFGPVGKGWSYQVEYKYLDKLVFAEVSIQYFILRLYPPTLGGAHTPFPLKKKLLLISL